MLERPGQGFHGEGGRIPEMVAEHGTMNLVPRTKPVGGQMERADIAVSDDWNTAVDQTLEVNLLQEAYGAKAAAGRYHGVAGEIQQPVEVFRICRGKIPPGMEGGQGGLDAPGIQGCQRTREPF